MRHLLDELAALIEQIEVKTERGTQGTLPRLIAENEATTRRIMDGIGTILHDVAAAGEPPEVADQVYELAASRLASWSSTSPVFYHVRNTPRTEFNNFEIALRLLECRRGGGNTAAQILDHYYLNMVTCSSFRNRFTQFAGRLAAETVRRASKVHPVRVLNLHSNTCHELELLARNRDFVEAVQITCLDRDPVALRRVCQSGCPEIRRQPNLARITVRHYLYREPVRPTGRPADREADRGLPQGPGARRCFDRRQLFPRSAKPRARHHRPVDELEHPQPA
jgi:hypothetical protein